MSLRVLECVSKDFAPRGRAARAGSGPPCRARCDHAGGRVAPGVESLEGRIAPTSFTLISPTRAGELPSGVTPVGGVVLDLVGASGRRVVSQLPASSLFRGSFADG